jgi:glucose-1-phosphate cytidylyltransferase
MTYGDGLGNVDVARLVAFHRANGKLATITATQAPGRFGAVDIGKDLVVGFREKPRGDGAWINGGFFVLEPAVFDYIEGDETAWEREPLERLAREGQLAAYRHDGFWQPVDTLRDKNQLEDLWQSGQAPWKVWR